VNEIVCYCDGGSKGSFKLSGYGYVFDIEGTLYEGRGAFCPGTNQTGELFAAAAALTSIERRLFELHGTALPTPSAWATPVRVVSDSEYLVKGMSEWLIGWKYQNWKTAANKPVANQCFWRLLDKLSGRFTSLTWKWVKGHSGIYGNERADGLATSALKAYPHTTKKAFPDPADFPAVPEDMGGWGGLMGYHEELDL
jgi:ribonuclease HI